MDIRELSVKIATVFSLGRLPLGGILASLFAFPVLWIISMLGVLSFQLVFLVISILFFCCIGVVYYVLAYNLVGDRSFIVLDKVVGIFIAFLFVPLSFKFMLFGFILFHGVQLFLQFVRSPQSIEDIGKFSAVVKIFVDDIVAGVAVNSFLACVLYFG